MNVQNYFLGNLLSGIPSVLVAVIYLILAFIVARIAKNLVMALLDKVGVEDKLAQANRNRTTSSSEKTTRGSKEKATEPIGQLVFLVVFLLFLPSVLSRLGMENVAQPITNAIDTVISFLPNLLAAGIIFFIGIYVAGIIRDLIKGGLNTLGINKLQEKIGVKAVENENTFSEVIAGVVYVLILIPIIIAVLEILGLNSIAQPASDIFNQILGYIPLIFISLILLALGYFISKIVAQLLESILTSVGVDRITENLLPEGGEARLSLSTLISEIVRWLILIIFFVEAVSVLNLDILTNIGSTIIAYLPILLSAGIILIGGFLLASWVENLILQSSPKSTSLAFAVKVLILVVAVFMTLSQLGFATSIVNLAFIIILAGFAIAFAISFGLGGRSFAEKQLEKVDRKIEEEKENFKEAEVNNTKPVESSKEDINIDNEDTDTTEA